MSNLKKKMSRNKLTSLITNVELMLNVFFITSVRATKNGSLSVEVCQNRILEGGSITALGLLNQSDSRFGSTGTLLFDWIKATPEDFVKVFPEAELTVAELQAVIEEYDENGPTGTEATVFPVMKTITKMVANGQALTPKIVVTEATETQIRNGEFFTASGMNQEERIAGALEDEYRVMKTSSDADADYIVDSITGDKIFRYTRTEAAEFNPQDRLIPNKVSKKVWSSRQVQSKAKGANPESILEESKELAY